MGSNATNESASVSVMSAFKRVKKSRPNNEIDRSRQIAHHAQRCSMFLVGVRIDGAPSHTSYDLGPTAINRQPTITYKRRKSVKRAVSPNKDSK